MLERRSRVVSRIAHTTCVQLPRSMPEGTWWRDLPEGFAGEPLDFDLAGVDRLRVGGTAALDVLVRTSAAASIALLALPLGYHPRALKAALGDLAFYEEMALSGDPGRFFEPPREVAPVRVRRAHPAGFRPPHGVTESLKYESTFVPRNPRIRKDYMRHERNRFAHVQYWRHLHGPRPTVVAIHGFGAETYALNQWFMAMPWFYDQLGFDVALFNLPFHGRRQTRFSPFSGHGFFAGGPSRINEAFAQAVHDFRALCIYLRERRGVEHIGVSGVSLGGHTTALLAACEPTLAFAIPNVPVVSIADLVLEWEPLGAILRAGLKAMGLSVTDARRLLAVSSPLTYRARLPRERLMVIGGVGDRMAPPKHSRILWDHWNRPRLHWFPGGHLLHLDRGGYLREIERFVRELGYDREAE